MFFAFHKDPAFPLQAEHPDGIFEAVAFQASGHVVAPDLLQGVDDVAAVDVGGAKAGIVGTDFVAARAVTDFELGPVAAPGKGHLQAVGPGADIEQVEIEDVVAFDHVGVAVGDTLVELP